MLKYLFIFFSFVLFGCSILEPKQEDKKLARVGDNFLYHSEIQELGISNKESIDSVEIVEAYLNSWLRKEAYLQHAKEELTNEQIKNIASKVSDYQESLYANEYEKQMIESKLNTSFTREELEAYYTKNNADFIIDKAIYKIVMLKRDQPFTNIKEINGWLNQYLKEGNDVQLSEYCLSNTIACILDTEVWMTDEKLLETFQIKSEYLNREVNQLIKLDSDGYYYLYKIIEKKDDGIYPLELVESEIKNILLKIREREFVEELRNEIFEQRKSKNQIEIF